MAVIRDGEVQVRLPWQRGPALVRAASVRRTAWTRPCRGAPTVDEVYEFTMATCWANGLYRDPLRTAVAGAAVERYDVDAPARAQARVTVGVAERSGLAAWATRWRARVGEIPPAPPPEPPSVVVRRAAAPGPNVTWAYERHLADLLEAIAEGRLRWQDGCWQGRETR